MAGVIPSAPLGTDAAADRPGLGAAVAAPRGGAAERRFRFELVAHPGSVARARRLAHARLTGWSVCADTCDSAALVISELVTNAIVHTASERVVCELHDHDDMVRIAVRDEGCAPGEPHPAAQRPDEEHGRGLLLVDALCRAWGAQEHGSGLLVWAELARREEPAAEPAAPREDLGWGSRPKPARPGDSGEDEPAEAHDLASGTGAEQPAHRVPGQPHPPHRAPEGHHRRHGTPDRRPNGAAEPYRHRGAEQPPHRAPEQRRDWERP
ncbi:Histidine kinase-like ATPase domain-containing protein [Streptomyces misionensis]|uniref:Histidine kinase-like ATPase domain-containing protein n=1 Tax=Streptomyces misionensis TaxID=67331 RepID=A0A1H4TVT3_9ACTN|nr:Histidine kinase-like ATPase domain-containing protein [Streptomyces misionensis]